MLGLILKRSCLGENCFVITCLTDKYGIIKGLVRRPNIHTSQLFQVGNVLQLNRFAKEHSLGVISGESYRCYMLLNMHHCVKMHIIASTCNLILLFFREGNYVNFDEIFTKVISCFNIITEIDDCNAKLLANFVLLQKYVMHEAGYGFSLSRCVATGSEDINSLIYISPKSASAVSQLAGLPYKNLMLTLPKFFIDENYSKITHEDALSGLIIIDFFVKKFCSKQLHSFMPNNLKYSLEYLMKKILK